MLIQKNCVVVKYEKDDAAFPRSFLTLASGASLNGHLGRKCGVLHLVFAAPFGAIE